MIDVLKIIIKEKLEVAGINYQFGEWTGEIKYPYFVGECTSDDYVYENKKTSGTLILDGWTRNSRLELLKADGKIKKIFASLVAVVGNKAFYSLRRCKHGSDRRNGIEKDNNNVIYTRMGR